MKREQQKPSLWALGALTPIELGKRVWKQVNEDEVAVRSTSLAYYFILAVFPAMVFVLSIIGLTGVGPQLQGLLFNYGARMLPGSALDLIRQSLQEVMRSSGAGLAVFGILGALWSASSGVSAVMQSLDVAYEVKEDRPWWKQKAVAVGLTLALAVLVLSALAVTLFGGKAADFVGSQVGLGGATVMLWKIVQWPVVLALMFVAFAITYYFAPNLEKPEWHWITPGSALGLLFWLVASVGFKIYLHFFNSYAKTYGSVGAVIILLLWLYITGFAIMLGGEVNSEIGRATDAHMRAQQKRKQAEEDADSLWGERRAA